MRETTEFMGFTLEDDVLKTQSGDVQLSHLKKAKLGEHCLVPQPTRRCQVRPNTRRSLCSR